MALQSGTRKRRDIHEVLQNSVLVPLLEKTGISRLNKDVMVEIFLHFVAIDWDGPFTLMLVCNKWSDLVSLAPTLWTWIMVDEFQPEWRERMEVAAHLSRNLPLRMVLKAPYYSQVSISHVVCRCVALFVQSQRFYYNNDVQRSRPWSKTMLSSEEFTMHRDSLKQLNEAISWFLRDVPTRRIRILSEDRDQACFAYSAWHVCQELGTFPLSERSFIQRSHLQQVLGAGQPYIISALTFKHLHFNDRYPWEIHLVDLWALLPSLANLSYLELSDTCIRTPKDFILPRITIPSVQTLLLAVEVRYHPNWDWTRDWNWRHRQGWNEYWESLQPEGELFNLLEFLIVPNVEYIGFSWSINRIIGVMARNGGNLEPEELHLSILSFEEATGEEYCEQYPVWHSLRRCSISLHDLNIDAAARMMPWSDSTNTYPLLFNMLPRDCSVQLHGGIHIQSLISPGTASEAGLHIIYRDGLWDDPNTTSTIPDRIESLTLIQDCVSEACEQWIGISEEVRFENEELEVEIYPNMSFGQTRKLESYADLMPYSLLINTLLFSKLVDLRCRSEFAVWIITNYDLSQLLSITLLAEDPQGSHLFPDAFNAIKRRSHTLIQLQGLGVDKIAYGNILPGLFELVAWCNRSVERKIAGVILPGLLHPALFRFLGQAFQGDVTIRSLTSRRGPKVRLRLAERPSRVFTKRGTDGTSWLRAGGIQDEETS